MSTSIDTHKPVRPLFSPCRWAALLVLTAGLGGCLPGGEPEVPPESDYHLEVPDSGLACSGTTFLTDGSDPTRPMVVEVDMEGNIVWELALVDIRIPGVAEDLSRSGLVGADIEFTDEGNILVVLSQFGVVELTHEETPRVLWYHLTEHISHDADRLDTGNTIFLWGGGDEPEQKQVVEVRPDGTEAWSWSAGDHVEELEGLVNFDAFTAFSQDGSEGEVWTDYRRGGWTHANAVTRMDNGWTMINLRNFALTVFVNEAGFIVHSIDWTVYGGHERLGNDPHEPEITEDGTVLVALQRGADYHAVEIPLFGRPHGSGFAHSIPIWGYTYEGDEFSLRTVRDADRLPNGNTLIQGVLVGPGGDDDCSTLIELAPDGTVVWQIIRDEAREDRTPGFFYKAERVASNARPYVDKSSTE